MPKPTEQEVKSAINIILNKRNYQNKALNYCINYAISALEMTGHELHVQVLYVLSNMTHWRGEDAKQVRSILKGFVK